MKLPFLTVLAAAFLAFTLTASAEDKPATPPPAPTVPAADAQEKAPVARKEEDEEEQKEAKEAKESSNEEARKGFFAKLFSGNSKKKEAAADEAAALRSENEQLKQRVSALEATVAEQKKQLAYIDDNWPAIEAALTKGDDKAPALQTDVGKKIVDAVAKGTAAAITSAGHDPEKLSGPGTKKPDKAAAAAAENKDPKRAGAAAGVALREAWAANGYTPPGLN